MSMRMKMARAVEPHWFDNLNKDGESPLANYPGQTKNYQNRAFMTVDDILDALMEPDDEMLEAVSQNPSNHLLSKAIWQAMLQHIKEQR